MFCIDEPELHVATGLQGRLIASILDLLPETTQLWIATHSIGIVREAYRIQHESPGKVTFLDFSDHNFDVPVTIEPSNPNRTFWARTFTRLHSMIWRHWWPLRRIVICEGSADRHVRGFDAKCYNELFADESPETPIRVTRRGWPSD